MWPGNRGISPPKGFEVGESLIGRGGGGTGKGGQQGALAPVNPDE